MAFANEKILVAVVEKNVVLFIDTNVLANPASHTCRHTRSALALGANAETAANAPAAVAMIVNLRMVY
jgi:hypothetical protein